MIFTTVAFYVFFALILLLLYFVNRKKDQHIILLLASYFFYAFWDIRLLSLMIFQTYVSYKAALLIDKNRGHAKMICGLFIAEQLIILGFFKYYNFFIENLKTIFPSGNFGSLYVILPIGISFYTFHAISYVVDVYRKKQAASEDFINISVYISFFPQLVAGPIVRSTDFLPQLETAHRISLQNLARGGQIFLFGLVKKLVIADSLSVFVDSVFAAPNAFDSSTIILAVVSYSIQIYFDFSGYSDMAIGAAKMMGYNLRINFNMPYVSKNPSEFWKRWHISLSSWLRDYLYIPIGGNRKGTARTYINLMITMFLGGLWHGASWNFVIWGVLHGIALSVHKFFLKFRKNARPNPLTSIISIAGTYIYVSFCWIFFRSETLTDALNIIKRMCSFTSSGIHQVYVNSIIAIILVFCASLYAYRENGGNGFYPVFDLKKFSSKLVIAATVFLIICFGYTGANPFIYFQF